MEPRRLRRGVTLGVIAATAATAAAIAAHPFPNAAPTPLPDTAQADATASSALAAREARAAARLREAERRLSAIAAGRDDGPAPVAVPAAPVASVAPPTQAPVTRSASS